MGYVAILPSCGPLYACFILVVVFGGSGDKWCRRHSSTMVTRHYVFGFSNVHDCALLSRLLRGWQ